MVSRPDRCRSDSLPDNHRNCGTDNPGHNSADSAGCSLPRYSEDSGWNDSDNSLQGNPEHNS